MIHSQEENWVTGKTHTRSASAYRKSIWTPVDEYDFDKNREKYIEAGWKSYCWTKGAEGYDKYFFQQIAEGRVRTPLDGREEVRIFHTLLPYR